MRTNLAALAFAGMAAGMGWVHNNTVAHDALEAAHHQPMSPNEGNWVGLPDTDQTIQQDTKTAKQIDTLSIEQRTEWAYLTLTLYGEARGTTRSGDTHGMQAVANVIMNRLHTGRWGDSIAEVVKSPHQFSCWGDSNKAEMMKQFENDQAYMALLGHDPEAAKIFKAKMEKNADWKAFQIAKQIAWKVYSGQLHDITNGATFYHTQAIDPSWNNNMIMTTARAIGGHVFFREKSKEEESRA